VFATQQPEGRGGRDLPSPGFLMNKVWRYPRIGLPSPFEPIGDPSCWWGNLITGDLRRVVSHGADRMKGKAGTVSESIVSA